MFACLELFHLHEEVKARAAVGMHPSRADMGLCLFFFSYSWFPIGSPGQPPGEIPEEKNAH